MTTEKLIRDAFLAGQLFAEDQRKEFNFRPNPHEYTIEKLKELDSTGVAHQATEIKLLTCKYEGGDNEINILDGDKVVHTLVYTKAGWSDGCNVFAYKTWAVEAFRCNWEAFLNSLPEYKRGVIVKVEDMIEGSILVDTE